jgi:ZIP family zinc transporter
MPGFEVLNPIVQTLIATLFTWGTTACGALFVFLRREPSRKFLDSMLGFASGVMLASSVFSLLIPSVELSGTWVPGVIGLLLGAVFLRFIDLILPHLHLRLPQEKAEGIKASWRRTSLLILAVTIHNIPEGLAIGISFGALTPQMEKTQLISALTLALGIGIQNLPEGLAVSLPLRREGFTAKKSFFFGQLSGAVEPMAALLGVILIRHMLTLLPYALGFAAGAMIFVVVEEVIPESQSEGHSDEATFGAIVGFALMMALDLSFKR